MYRGLGPHMVLIFSAAAFLCCTERRKSLEGEEPGEEERQMKNSKHAVQKPVISTSKCVEQMILRQWCKLNDFLKPFFENIKMKMIKLKRQLTPKYK